MRIAICLSGQLRTWRQCIEGLQTAFPGQECDYFLQLWQDEPAEERKAAIAAYRPVDVAEIERPDFESLKSLMMDRFPQQPPLTVVDMWHAIDVADQLRRQSNRQYDLVLRSRYDLRFTGQFARGLLRDVNRRDRLAVPNHHGWHGGCNDQLALGNPKVMTVYTSLSRYMAQAFDVIDGTVLYPERLLRYWLEHQHVDVLEAPIPAHILRSRHAGQNDGAWQDDAFMHLRKHFEWRDWARRYGKNISMPGWRGGDDSYQLLAPIADMFREQAGQLSGIPWASLDDAARLQALMPVLVQLFRHDDPSIQADLYFPAILILDHILPTWQDHVDTGFLADLWRWKQERTGWFDEGK